MRLLNFRGYKKFMFARRKPKMAGMRRTRHSVQGASRWRTRIAFALAIFTLFSLLLVDTSQACPNGTSPAVAFTQIAQSGSQVAEPQLVLKGAAAVAPIVKFGIQIPKCCAGGLAHCVSFGCAGPCCATGTILAGWPVAWDIASLLWIPLNQAQLSSLDSESQFRPPRTTV